MSAFRVSGRLFTPAVQQCRHKSKINVQRPQPRHLDRRIFEAVTIPITPDDLLDPHRECPRLKRSLAGEEYKAKADSEVNEYEEYLVRKARYMLTEHQMIAVFQQVALNPKVVQEIQRMLKPHSLGIKLFGNEIMSSAIRDTKWASVSPLLVGRNAYVMSTDVKVKEMLKVTQKIPELILLGGIVGDMMYTKDGLQNYAKLPDIATLRGQLLFILNTNVGRTRTLLGQHQQTLSQSLDQYIKDNSPVS